VRSREGDHKGAAEHEKNTMFAVIKTGGKQYKVSRNDVITIEKLYAEAGDTVAFETVLMVGGDTTVIGTPTVKGATVAGSVVEQARGPKVISFFKRRRQNSKRKKGHRQDLTVVRITDIFTNGEKVDVTVKAAPAAAAVVAAAAKPAKAAKADAGAIDDSNLSLIAGIGPTIEKKLRAAGITTWTQISKWTAGDVETWNTELKLGGRVTREEWVEQAKELLAGKPPRAKVDQAEKASGKDL
jgi:large subunit ribosomal protein L21